MHGSVQLGPFSVGERIGDGGMGTVYRGEHRETGVEVAIKVIRRVLRDRARRQFHQEVQSHAALQHPGVVYLFEYGDIDETAAELSDGDLRPGDPFVAMELADRGTVRDAMPPDSWKTVCRLLIQVLDALAYAHARGVVHRDLKPENILLFEGNDSPVGGWRAKLADFGIAHAPRTERDADTEQLESAAGTPLYMAPEQFRGRWRSFGPWTDLYAVGCIAWELVCGRPPFSGENFLSIAMSHETDQRPPLHPQFSVPDELETWIHRAMTPDPQRRFRRAADAAWALPREVLLEEHDQGGAGGATSATAETDDFEETLREGARRRTETMTLASTIELVALDERARAETRVDIDDDSTEGSRPEPTAEGILRKSHPPLPPDWRPEAFESLPAPLVGAGLGLFGLREPPFVDRTEECDRIWEAMREVVEQQSLRIVLIASEAGTGKSRLAEWMATRAHEVGACGIVRATHTQAGGPNEGLSAALEEKFRCVKMERGKVFERLLDALPLHQELGEDWRRRDARALTEFLRPTEDDADKIDGPRYRFSSADQKRGLIVRILRRLGARRPVLLWLDDLQWGEEALGLLEELTERHHEHGELLVVATVRSDILRERPNLAARIEGIEKAECSIRLPLAPLGKGDQHELLQGLLPLEEKLAERLAERTEGHPLFAMQLLAHWIEEGALEVSPDGFRVPADRVAEVPTDIHELWLERIDRLVEQYPPSTRAPVLVALEVAATLGREVDGAEWQELCESADAPPPEELRNRLVEAGLAERTDRGWAFAHGLLVDSLEEHAREQERWEAHHRRCVELLEALYPGRPDRTAARRAEHCIEAGDLEEALEPLLQKAMWFEELGEHEGRRQVLERRRMLLESLDVSESESPWIENEMELVAIDMELGTSSDSILERLEELQRRSSEAGHKSLVAKAWSRIAAWQQQTGQYAVAADAARKATRAARSSGEVSILIMALVRRGWAMYFLGELDRAEELLSEACARATELGHDNRALHAKLGLAWSSVSRGDDERAVALFEEIHENVRDTGYRSLQARCLNGLAELARFQGDADEARRLYRRFRELQRELNQRVAVGTYNLNLAQVELMAGRLPEAEQHLAVAERQYDELSRSQQHFHLIRACRLTHAAGTEKWPTFDELFSLYADGWPEDARLITDHPWLLEMAGDYAAEAGELERAQKAWRLARNLWDALGDDDAADRVAEKRNRSSTASP